MMMMMKRMPYIVAALVAMSALAAASSSAAKEVFKGASRIGVGVNLSRIDARYELSADTAIDAFVDLHAASGDAIFGKSSFGTGGYYLRRIAAADPVGAHLLAGFGLDFDNAGGRKYSDFTLFAGFGAEYFLPGTKQLSIEANVGLGIHFLRSKTKGVSSSGIHLHIDDLTRGVIMLRYYFK